MDLQEARSVPTSPTPASLEYDQRFRAFADRLPLAVWQLDTTGALVFANAAWYRITALPREAASLLPGVWSRVVHPNDVGRLTAVVASAVQARAPYRLTLRLKPVTGDARAYRWYDVQAEPEHVEGAFHGWTGYTADVHEVHDGNALFRQLFDANIIGIFVVDAAGRIIRANDDFLRVIGYTPADVAAGLAWSAISADPSGGDQAPVEREYVHKDGRRVPVLVAASMMSEGTVLCYALDLTVEKAAHSALAATNDAIARSERYFRSVLEAIPVIMWTAGPDGALEWYNRQWFAYTGQTEEEAAGWGWQSAHHPDDFLQVMDRWPASIATGEPFEMQFRLKDAAGDYRWFLTRAQPIKDESGAVLRWYGSNIDVQEQTLSLERAQRISETLQRVFLPDALPQPANVRFDAVYVPAEKDAVVGGDWFEAVQLPDRRFLVTVGDVSGHGFEASVVAGRLRQAVLDFAMRGDDAADILRNVNAVLRFQTPDVYATAVVGFIDEAATTFAYGCAGHPPPLVGCERDDPARRLPYGGLPLGVEGDVQVTSGACSLPPDTVLVLYTDGLTESARDIEGAETRLAREASTLVGDASVERPAQWLTQTVLGDVPPTDDIAVLVVQCSPAAARAARPAGLEKRWRFHSSDASTARLSRQELMKFISGHAAQPETLFNAELVLGEILANLVEHAPGLVEMHLDWSALRPVLTVLDTGPGLETLNGELPQDVWDENGRGLFLICSLAEDVSLTRAPGGGSRLRVTLPVTRDIVATTAGTVPH